ncbi:MAG: PhzF family phenazine biosynthesis protein [Chitinophagaceae bacterium]
MKLDLYQIDAFTDKVFGGNPACVVPLDNWLKDDILLKIAKENAVAETAFFTPYQSGFHIRWFTPEFEMDLCGHATLASAHALTSILNHTSQKITFYSNSGELEVMVEKELYTLNFPARKPVPSTLPDNIKRSLSKQPGEVLKSRDYVLVYENEQDILDIKIDRVLFDQINLDPGGVIVTAKGNSCDFVARFFTPQASIFEDPVTGSAYCSLIPYWSEQLHKKQMNAVQLSERVGKLHCIDNGDRVLIAGNARTYSIGSIWVD